MKATTLCFLLKEEGVLLAMKKRGFGVGRWNGVGGKVKPGESIEQAAVREAYEEIGVTIQESDLRPMGTLVFLFADNPDWDNECRIFFIEQWSGEPAESEEMLPQWFSKDKLPFKTMWVDDPHWLPLVLGGKRIKAKFIFNDAGTTIGHASVKTVA